MTKPTMATRLEASQRLVATSLAETSLDVLARAIEKDDITQVSRMRSNQLGLTVQQCVRLLNAAGCKVVPIDATCFKPGFVEYVRAIETLLQRLQSEGLKPSFELDDD